MVGVAGWDPSAAHPDSGPVTCKRCLRLREEVPPGIEQLELFAAAPVDGGRGAGDGQAAQR